MASAAPLHCREGLKFKTVGSAILLQVTLTVSAHCLLRNLLKAAVGGPHMQKQKHPADTTGCLPHPRPLRSHGSTVLRAE